ncbi:hypothetical protein RCG17_06760 [Neobacillus sp. PS3-12]|uniref:hypothetical protein n=1 Tax=Neobacillus sp. PS3-12 TaxID=3070677 RepID=UPI0027DF8FBA|nr:hypothetical protein [Neobacillus sp. PS3-12]WML54341.1 hypothetical protein RCG17_06760 [Neobacillus sp. PS3-12]
MQTSVNLRKRDLVFERAWFMWFFLILIPPLGIIILWRQGRFKKSVRWIISLIAILYFLLPFIVVATTKVPLFYSHDDVIAAFNKAKKELHTPYQLKTIEKNDQTITSQITKDITLVENLDKGGQVRELIMVGQGEGTDILLALGTMIKATNPEFSKSDLSSTIKDLKVMDEGYHFTDNGVTVKTQSVQYNLKYSDKAGVIFTASRVD